MLISKTFVNFSQAFATSSEPVSDFFAQAGIGYYIPLYQREYSWDLVNVDQLMEDLSQGVESLLEKDDAILFMGTVILLTESNPQQNINPRDLRALPSRIDNVIDGQQRISTFALLATLVHMRLQEAGKALLSAASNAQLDPPTLQEINQVQQEIDSQLAVLVDIFSVDLRRGQPKLKPIIIRGSVDCWTLDGADDANYKSDVAQHLAYAIRSIQDNIPYPSLRGGSAVKSNLRRMNDHLSDVVGAHKDRNDQSEKYPAAWRILQGLPQEAIWSYAKPHLVQMMGNIQNPLTAVEDRLCAVVQLLAFTNFLLKRCCFTVIKPTAETWAFDMFQSLNATGTPLTAVETFKPMVSNYMEMHGGYKGSLSETYFNDVDNFLGQAKTANQKNKTTKDYLTTFALVQDGRKIPSQFSAQRKYLEEHYDARLTDHERAITTSQVTTGGDVQAAMLAAEVAKHEEFVRRMSDLSVYQSNVSDAVVTAQTRIPLTSGASDTEQELAVLCVAYLKKANHRMADTVLSRFYAILRRADTAAFPAARDEFLVACKALAAFYTLWRSASSNSGLDDFYRKLMRGSSQPGVSFTDGLSWAGDPALLTSTNLKAHLRQALVDRNIGTKATWKSKASTDLRYGYNGGNQVCRFVTFVAAHDTVPDPTQPGLMVVGQPGVNPYLRLEKWVADDLSSIEHIAPQNSDARAPWDTTLYDDDCSQRVGNLTLLPIEINISASNRGWQEKCLYYQYLTVQNPAVDRPAIQQEATNRGIVLNPVTIHRLETATHSAHIKPIAAVGMGGQWNRTLIEERSERICDILWDRIYGWLQ